MRMESLCVSCNILTYQARLLSWTWPRCLMHKEDTNFNQSWTLTKRMLETLQTKKHIRRCGDSEMLLFILLSVVPFIWHRGFCASQAPAFLLHSAASLCTPSVFSRDFAYPSKMDAISLGGFLTQVCPFPPKPSLCTTWMMKYRQQSQQALQETTYQT